MKKYVYLFISTQTVLGMEIPSKTLQYPDYLITDVMHSLNPANNPQILAQALVEKGVSVTSDKTVIHDLFCSHLHSVIYKKFPTKKDVIDPFIDPIICFFHEIYEDIIRPHVEIVEKKMIKDFEDAENSLGVRPILYDNPIDETLLKTDDDFSVSEDLMRYNENSRYLSETTETKMISFLNPAHNPQVVAQALIDGGINLRSSKKNVYSVFQKYLMKTIQENFCIENPQFYPLFESIMSFFKEIYESIIKPHMKILINTKISLK